MTAPITPVGDPTILPAPDVTTADAEAATLARSRAAAVSFAAPDPAPLTGSQAGNLEPADSEPGEVAIDAPIETLPSPEASTAPLAGDLDADEQPSEPSMLGEGGAGAAAAVAAGAAAIAAQAADAAEPVVTPELADSEAASNDAPEPRSPLPIAVDGPDEDLMRIKGMDEDTAATLGDLGYRRYEQLAALTPEQVAHLDTVLDRPGRAPSEGWAEQATILSRGAETYFSRRRYARSAPTPAPAQSAPPAASDAPAPTAPPPEKPKPIGLEPTGGSVGNTAAAAGGLSGAAVATGAMNGWALRARDLDGDGQPIEALARAARDAVIEPSPAPDAAPETAAQADVEPAFEQSAAAEASLEPAPDPSSEPTPGPTSEPDQPSHLETSDAAEPQVASDAASDFSSPEPANGERVAEAEAPADETGEPSTLFSTRRRRERRELRERTDQRRRGGGRVVQSGDADDLKRIRGVGVVIEKKLNAMGIYSYAQIAEWTDGDIQKVNEVLDFSGRIERENWIEQARILSSRA